MVIRWQDLGTTAAIIASEGAVCVEGRLERLTAEHGRLVARPGGVQQRATGRMTITATFKASACRADRGHFGAATRPWPFRRRQRRR